MIIRRGEKIEIGRRIMKMCEEIKKGKSEMEEYMEGTKGSKLKEWYR